MRIGAPFTDNHTFLLNLLSLFSRCLSAWEKILSSVDDNHTTTTVTTTKLSILCFPTWVGFHCFEQPTVVSFVIRYFTWNAKMAVVDLTRMSSKHLYERLQYACCQWYCVQPCHISWYVHLNYSFYISLANKTGRCEF